MANSRPTRSNWESWVDTVIREGQERGEFDDLPGAGRPIEGLDKPHDDLWWVRKKLRDEDVSYLPPTLALRKDKEDTLATIRTLRSESRARQMLEELNERIRAVNRRLAAGPPSTVMPLDVEQELAEWREASRPVSPATQPKPEPARPDGSPNWFRRMRRAARGSQSSG